MLLPREGLRFMLPDERVGRVARCRACGAEIVLAYNERRRRTHSYDPDGEPHVRSCADAAEDREAEAARGGR